MENEVSTIRYRFHLAAKVTEDIGLDFDRLSFRPRLAPVPEEPAWAVLDFHKCGHCPLKPTESPFCPFAQALSRFIDRFIKAETQTPSLAGLKADYEAASYEIRLISSAGLILRRAEGPSRRTRPALVEPLLREPQDEVRQRLG